jgi:hypothetical protein
MLSRVRRRALVVLVPFAVLPLLVAATHGSKKLTVLSCGDTITNSTTLSSDIGPCGGNGVIIGADHVTLNLNGHRISGAGGNNGVFSNNVGVVVENGSVVNFNIDVQLQGNSSRVINLRASNAAATGIVINGANSVISGNRSFGNVGHGMFGNGAGSQYINNVLQGNAGSGIDAEDASVISGNKALSNGTYGIVFTNSLGGSVTVTNNLANGNAHHGLAEGGGDPTVVTLSGNKAYFNTQVGISAGAGVNDGGNNKASGNGTLAQCTNIVCS